MKVDLRKPGHWVLVIKQAVYTLTAIVLRPFRKRPDKPLVLLYGHQLSGNIKALYTEWSDSGMAAIDLYFLSLDPVYSASLRADGIRVLQCNRLRDMLQLSRASALVSDHGLHLMWPLVRLTDILFIDVWHGIPFKGFVPGEFSLQHRYDEIWVSSPLLKQLYEEKFGFEAEKVRSLGYARTDRLFSATPDDNAFKQAIDIPSGNKVILYAPTWQQDIRGRDLFPFDQGEELFIGSLDKLCDEHSATLVIRSHLNADIGNRNYDNVIYCSQRVYPDTEEVLIASDILICDWSSIAFDFLALHRPTIFLEIEPPFKNGFSLGREYRFGKVVQDMDSLGEALKSTLDDPKAYFADQERLHREITRKVYGDNVDGHVASRQLHRLIEIVRR